MQDYRIETKVERDGSLTIHGLPFHEGDRVEVIIRSHEGGNGDRYPLRGKPLRYANPFDSVAEQDWSILR